MIAIEYLDSPPTGWFALDVMRKKARKWDWVALMVDVDPDKLKHCLCKNSRFCTSIQTNTGPMEIAERVKHGSVSPASIETRMPPGRLSKT